MYTSSDSVSNVDFLDINFGSAGFVLLPFINASTDSNVNVFVSDITATTARLNFSSKFTGTVRYIVTSKSP